MLRWAKLPLTINIRAVQQEVTALSSGWQPHFNTRHYNGNWTVLPLRSPGGETGCILPEVLSHGGFGDTPGMNSCPEIRTFLSQFNCPLMSVRLLNLAAGAEIKEHRDRELSFEQGEARLHVPIFTNEHVRFYVQGQRVQMEEGDCWYLNAGLPHSVCNNGDSDRIHLVIDCIVNDWLKQLFDKSEKQEATTQDNTVQRQVIEELRRKGTPEADQLALQLEAALEN